VEVGDRVAVLGEQLGDLRVEAGDALVEVFDVASEIADATSRNLPDDASPKLIRLSRRSSRWRVRLTTRASPTGSI
jgi:hypothetical protein